MWKLHLLTWMPVHPQKGELTSYRDSINRQVWYWHTSRTLCASGKHTTGTIQLQDTTHPRQDQSSVRRPSEGGREKEREREKETRCLVCPAHPGYTHPSIYSWIHSARRVNSAEFGLILSHPLSPLIFMILPPSLYISPLCFILISRYYYNSCSLIFLTTEFPARNRVASRTRYA